MNYHPASLTLVTTFKDLAQMLKKVSQIDTAVLDFSKAFDTVPHDGLLSNSSTTAWMMTFGYGFIIF